MTPDGTPGAGGQDLTGTLLSIRYIPAREAVLWDANAKRHDMEGLKESIRRHGFRDAPIYDGTLGAIAAGNGRATALREMELDGDEPPPGVGIGPDGTWHLPMQFGVDAASQTLAESFAVDHNNLALSGGEFTEYDMARMWDGEGYAAILKRLSEEGEEPLTASAEFIGEYLEDYDEPEPQEAIDDTPETRKVTYDTTTVRQITLIMDVPTYEQVLSKFLTLMRAEGLDTNSQVVLHLLERYPGGVEETDLSELDFGEGGADDE